MVEEKYEIKVNWKIPSIGFEPSSRPGVYTAVHLLLLPRPEDAHQEFCPRLLVLSPPDQGELKSHIVNNVSNRIHNKMSNRELMLYLQVAYSSWLLLLWLTSLYLVTGLGSQDDTLRYFLLLPPSIGSSDTIPTMTFPQECDPRHRLACHGLHHPQLPLGRSSDLFQKQVAHEVHVAGVVHRGQQGLPA